MLLLIYSLCSMQAQKSVAKEKAVSSQLRQELYDARQKVSQVCWTLPACITLATAAILLNGKRCLFTALVGSCVFQGLALPGTQCSTGV